MLFKHLWFSFRGALQGIGIWMLEVGKTNFEADTYFILHWKSSLASYKYLNLENSDIAFGFSLLNITKGSSVHTAEYYFD